MNDAKPSKSEKKRQYQALQELGERLIELPEEQLRSIDTDPYLIEQVRAARDIKSHGALRRQKQLIGKIMRQVDPEPIRASLGRFTQGDHINKAVFAQSEVWRDRLVVEGEPALEEFLSTVGTTGLELPRLLKQCAGTPDTERQRSCRREIFREIHKILSSKMQNPAL